MRFLPGLLFLLLLLLAAVPYAFGKNVTADLQQQYDGMKTMKASFVQTLIHKESGVKENREGVLTFKKPLLVRWETMEPNPELLMVTSREIWNVFPDEEIAYRYSLDMVKGNTNILRVITGQSQLEQNFIIEKQSQDGEYIKLHLIPKEPVQALVEAFFWIDPEKNIIRKFRLIDFYGNINEIAFTSLELGASVADGIFVYVPPSSIQVEDRTQDTGNMENPLLK